MGRELRLYLEQIWRLTVSEFKLREQSTLLGFLWTLLQPLLLFCALFGLFTRWTGRNTADYAAYLLIGVVQYGFFNSGTTFGLSALNRRSSLLLNFRLPREIIVLSAVLSVATSYLFELATMLVFLLLLGIRPNAAWAYLPLLIALHVALVVGLCLWLSVIAARFRDWERIWSVVTTAGFFLTPIFYTMDSISPARRRVLLLNPMTHVIELTRGCLMRGEAPSPRIVAALAAACVVLCWGGRAFFKRHELRLGDFVALA
jgi:ABC-type polysaccharide/polyol phosphate export permease